MRVLITGSSRGLGEAFVNYYKAEDAEVFGLGRSELTQVDYKYKQVDISNELALKDVLSSLFKDVKHIDMIVLNAGILGRIQDTSKCEMSQLKKEMDINMWANKTILDFFIKNKIEVKQVIAISSGASVNGSLGWNGYSLSKAALNMLIKLYAAEMKDTHLISLAPGLIKTDMIDSILKGDHDTKKYTSVQSLRNSDKKGLVYSPEVIVEKIMGVMPALLKSESGSFLDIREL